MIPTEEQIEEAAKRAFMIHWGSHFDWEHCHLQHLWRMIARAVLELAPAKAEGGGAELAPQHPSENVAKNSTTARSPAICFECSTPLNGPYCPKCNPDTAISPAILAAAKRLKEVNALIERDLKNQGIIYNTVRIGLLRADELCSLIEKGGEANTERNSVSPRHTTPPASEAVEPKARAPFMSGQMRWLASVAEQCDSFKDFKHSLWGFADRLEAEERKP